MNVNQREMKDHVEFESNTYYAAFAAELEASATPMWALISHLKNPVSSEFVAIYVYSLKNNNFCILNVLKMCSSISNLFEFVIFCY